MGRLTSPPRFSVGAELRALRHARGVTLGDLAAKAGLSASFLSQLERGLAGASLNSLQRIAEALGVPLADLLNPIAMTPAGSSGQSGHAAMTRGSVLQVHSELREAILSGALRPGDELSAQLVAERNRVSQPAARAALRQLLAEQLVHELPQGGFEVSGFTADELGDLCAVRETLEEMAAARAAVSASSMEISALHRRVDDDRAALERAYDVESAAARNASFHEALWFAARNRYLAEQLRSLQSLIRRLQPAGGHGDATSERQAIEEHAAIVEALEQRDSVEAAHRTRTHFERETGMRLKSRRRPPRLEPTRVE